MGGNTKGKYLHVLEGSPTGDSLSILPFGEADVSVLFHGPGPACVDFIQSSHFHKMVLLSLM